MSRPADLLGRIARARADMILRGHDRLCLHMGSQTAREFAEESHLADIEDWLKVVMNLPIKVTKDMEGFMISPRED